MQSKPWCNKGTQDEEVCPGKGIMVPGVVCQVTEHNNHRIVCTGGVLKDCLIFTRFWVEPINRAEHYGLSDELQDWEAKPKISIREALHVISIMGGQAFFFCNCKESCDKNSCKCKKNGRACNSKCHPSNMVKCSNWLLMFSCPTPELGIPFQNGIPSY
jgi:hypothetical protein